MYNSRASQGALVVNNPPSNAEDLRDAGLILGSGRSPRGRHPIFLPGECHGQRSLVGYSLWSKESDAESTEVT